MATTSTDRRFGASSGLGWKAPVIAATTANITLSATQTVDGVALSAEDRVLVKDQDTATENGIYVVSTGSWVRAPDFDGNYDVVQHTLIPVAQGTTNAATWWRVTNTGDITIDTTSLTFEQVTAFSSGGSSGFTVITAVTAGGSNTSEDLSVGTGANIVMVSWTALGTSATGSTGVPRIQLNNTSSITAGIGSVDGTSALGGTTGTDLPLATSGTSPHDWASGDTLSGMLTMHRITGNTWSFIGGSRNSNDTDVHLLVGSAVLSAELSTISFTTSGGTATISANSIMGGAYQ